MGRKTIKVKRQVARMVSKHIKNRKAFTLIELMFSVSIFSIIILMTFSIVNYAPRLAKSESRQFGERTNVRNAMADISEAIQNAASIATPPLIFSMPDGQKITYEYINGNVNKVIDGNGYRLMESIEEFSIETADNHIFNIHIKTSEEGMDYNTKVERRKGGGIKPNIRIGSISPETAVFDKNIDMQQDIAITLDLNGTELVGLRNDLNLLNSTQDYTIDGDILILKKEYLRNQANGTIYIVFDLSLGVDPVLTVEIKDTSSNIKIAGNAYKDDLVRMEFPGNTRIDPDDNKWILTIIDGTLSDDISQHDMIITGLPVGITAAAVKGPGNKIEITLSGTAAPVEDILSAEIIVKASGVVETGALDSDAIEVFILPGASFASPEHNMVFTNEIEFKNNVTITGDIVIGRNKAMSVIENNCNIYGYLYVSSSLTANNNTTIGNQLKKSKVFVSGSAIFNNYTAIYGDLYYKNTLETKNKFDITGEAKQATVEIPPVSMPSLKSEQWYIDNDYTIVDTSGSAVTLEDYGKYYFKEGYTFNNTVQGLDNVTIVGRQGFTFNNNFSGSGIIFAPNGKIVFNNTCNFTGLCISNSTVLNNNSILTYKRYAKLPFD